MAAIADDGAESSLCNRGPSSLWNESFIVSCRATAACANRPAESGFEYEGGRCLRLSAHPNRAQALTPNSGYIISIIIIIVLIDN